MEKTMRRITSICIVFMLLCVTGKSMVYACEIDEKNENQQIMIVESGVDIEQISTDELNSVELLVLDEEVYEEQDVHEMQEVLDNGTDILICGDEFEEVSNDFNIEYDIEVGATDVIAGYYLSSNGSEYYVNPIEYELMIDVNDENISNEDKIEILNQILRTEEIDAETIYRDVQSNDGDNWFSSLSDDEKAELQTSTALGNSFTDKSKFVYLYTRQNTSVEPENVYSSAESFTNYQKIGSLRFLLYGINLKTKDSSTYDIVYAECTAGALNSAYVQQFTVGI